jgi:uncharacterized cupin superfamily protein
MFFNSTFVQAADGNLIVDPLPLTDADAQQIDDLGGAKWVVLTNRDHQRAARYIAARFGAKIAAGEREVNLFTVSIDHHLRDGMTVGGADIITLDGHKTPGEIVLSFPRRQAAIVGDALWGDPAGALRFPPDEMLIDPMRAVLSLRKLWELELRHLFLGDGQSLFGCADEILGDFLRARSDAFINRINFDELRWETEDVPETYTAATAEIGLLIGARKLGYRLVTLDPGRRYCPLHAHSEEEELYLVLEGHPMVRTLRGEIPCRAGDVLSFPAGDHGAHQLINRSAAPCKVFILGNVIASDICYYPDSDKILVRSRNRLIIRASPEFDYFDGE